MECRPNLAAPGGPVSALLEVRLSAGFRSRQVLHEVAFRLVAGEVFGLVGESGAGKSTVASAILCLLRWSGGWASGEIQWGSRNLLRLKEREIRRIRGRE